MEALLIQITVKATAVLMAAWLVTRVMARGSAASRHLVWTAAVVAVLALPLVQLAGPRWDVPVLPGQAAAAPSLGSDPLHGATQPLDTPREGGLTPTVPTVAEVPPATAPAAKVEWSTVLPGLWLTGVAFALMRLAAGLLWAGLITRRATTVTDAQSVDVLEDAAATLRVTTPVSLKSSADTTIPVACGLL